MNRLILGLGDKTELLDVKQGFLLIDDGPLCDQFVEKFSKKVLRVFEPTRHHFNPLPMDYRRARELRPSCMGQKERTL